MNVRVLLAPLVVVLGAISTLFGVISLVVELTNRFTIEQLSRAATSTGKWLINFIKEGDK